MKKLMNKKKKAVLAAVALTVGVSSAAFAMELFGTQVTGECAFTLQRMPDVMKASTTEYKSTLQMTPDDIKNYIDLIKATFAFSLKLTKEFENNGKLVVRFKGGEGNGLNDNLETYSKINESADPGAFIKNTELFYQQSFLDNKFIVNFGKFGVGAYFADNNYTSQFLTGAFSTDKTISISPSLLALRLNYAAITDISIDYAYFTYFLTKASPGPDKGLSILQVTYKPHEGGNYRVYVWTNNTYHRSYQSREMNRKYYGTCGIGISADYAINERVGVFAKIGHKNPYVGTINDREPAAPSFNLPPPSTLWNVGIQLKDLTNNALGFAIGQISGDCVLKSNNIDNFKYGKETQIELYYKYKINNNISIIANLQYLANLKGGNTSYNHDTVVIGIRTLIAF